MAKAKLLKPVEDRKKVTIKIEAIVKANGHENWYVLSRKKELKYKKYGSDTIVGTDGTFFNFYYHDHPSKSFKAFAGRKFDIELEDGTVVHCNGQWWDGVSKRAIEEFRLDDDQNKIIRIATATIEELKDCYVFCSSYAIKSKIDKLREEYTGRVYEYWEYGKILREEKKMDASKQKNTLE